MQAFIINLDSAEDRWVAITRSFAHVEIMPRRVPAVEGKAIAFPHEGYSEQRFRWFHGRRTNSREVGCFWSHIKAMQAFLETPDAHGLICEDDITLGVELEKILGGALRHCREWNILRLTGLGRGKPVKVAELFGGYHLCVGLGRLKGSGAYLIDRTAAAALVARLLPMWLPFDHALDREWWFGLRAACVLPFPCSQTDGAFGSSIQSGKTGRLPSLRRWLTTYPYQACNELARWCFRGSSYVRWKFARSTRLAL